MALGAAFTDLAFSAALVQKKTITQDDETSVFYLNIGSGLALTLLLCAISPWVADFFHQDVLMPLLCVQSMTILISSFGIVQSALITRSMSFKTNAIIELINSIFSGTIGIGMAILGFGVWSLVGMNLARAFCGVILLWMLRKWRPCGKFCMKSVRSMWGFSGKLLYASLLHSIATNLYAVVIGRVFPPSELGLFTRANSFPRIPTGLLISIVQRVAFPLFSRNQDNRAFLLAVIRRQNRILLYFTTVILTFLAVIADELIPLLIGPKWNGAIPLMQIFCLSGVFASAFPLHSELLKALGKSNLFFWIEMFKKVVIVIVIACVYRFGVLALTWGAVGISISDYILSAWPNVSSVGYTWRMQAWDILSPLIMCLACALIVSLFNWTFLSFPLAILIGKALFLAVLIGLGTALCRRTLFSDVWSLLLSACYKFKLVTEKPA